MTAKKRKAKPFWERGYNGHAYWLGKAKLGKVTLLSGEHIKAEGKYHWAAAGRAGYTEHLGKAKSAVELAVSTADKQLDLFQQ